MTPTGSSLGTLDPARLSHLERDGAISAATSRPRKRSYTPPCMPSGRHPAPSCICIRTIRSPSAAAWHRSRQRAAADHGVFGHARRCARACALFSAGRREARRCRRRAGRQPSRHPARQSRAGRRRASLAAATDAIEELEETARLYLLLRREAINPLTNAQVVELKRRFPSPDGPSHLQVLSVPV